jgi:hypothetical protein
MCTVIRLLHRAARGPIRERGQVSAARSVLSCCLALCLFTVGCKRQPSADDWLAQQQTNSVFIDAAVSLRDKLLSFRGRELRSDFDSEIPVAVADMLRTFVPNESGYIKLDVADNDCPSFDFSAFAVASRKDRHIVGVQLGCPGWYGNYVVTQRVQVTNGVVLFTATLVRL